MFRRNRTGLLAASAILFAAEFGAAQTKLEPRKDELPAGAVARLGSLRWRHATAVALVAVLPDNRSVLTASRDHVIRLWDRETGKEIRRFESSSVKEDFEPRYLLRPVVATLSPDGKTLAAALWNDAISIWDIKTGKELRQFKRSAKTPFGANSLRFSPAGKTLAMRNYMQAITFFDLETGQERPIKNDPKDGQVMPGSQGGMAFSPDGAMLVNGKMGYDQANNFTFVHFMDVKSGAEIRRFDTRMKSSAGIAFAPGGKVLAYSVGDIIHLQNAESGKDIRQIKTPAPITAVIFSPDGKTILSKAADQQVRIWKTASGEMLHEWGDKAAFPEVFATRASEDRGLSLSADGKIVACADGQIVRLRDVFTGKDLLAAPIGHRAAVSSFGVHADSKTLVSHGEDDTLRRWDLATLKQLDEKPVIAGTTIVRFSPDAKTAALANSDGTIRLVELASGKELRRFKGHASPDPNQFHNDTADLAFSPDGKLLASQGSFDNSVRIYRVEGGELRQITLALVHGIRRNDCIAGLGLAFSEDGETLALNVHQRPSESYWPAHGQLRQWHVATGKELPAIVLKDYHFAEQIAYSPDGRLLVAAHADQTISLYETASGKLRAVLGKPQPLQKKPWIYQRRFDPVPIKTLAFSPDSRRLLSHAVPGTFRVWDLHACEEIGQFKGHDGPVVAAAFAPDGKTIITGSNDTTLLVWDAGRWAPKPLAPLVLIPKELDALWADLRGADAAAAFASIQKLASAPKEAVPFLRGRMHPVQADTKRIDKLVADLDSSDFRTRTQAAKELAGLGELALHALKNARVATVEMRRRVDTLVEALAPIARTDDDVRAVRAVEVLERLDVPDGRKLLGELARGTPGALLTRQASLALDRMKR